MKCPVCKEEMIILELHQIEIDYCSLCDGIWLDEGELELLLEGASERDTLLASFKTGVDTREKPYRCPRCSRKMQKVLAGTGQEVLIDKCTKGHGLWFDSGELHEVIRLGSLDPQNKVLGLLNEMFSARLKKQ